MLIACHFCGQFGLGIIQSKTNKMMIGFPAMITHDQLISPGTCDARQK